MKPWREVAVPHADVLKGTFQQAEFAADITAVHSGKAPPVYQDAAAFFKRTYITEGMRLLLTQVAQRLSGRGGEPVAVVTRPPRTSWPSQPGTAKDRTFWMAPDFDAPLDDFANYME